MIKIAIVDSGVKTNHTAFVGDCLSGFSLYVDTSGEVQRDETFNDNVGHGTAIYYLIRKLTCDISESVYIDNIKIFFDDSQQLDQVSFEKILAFIAEHYSYDIINISMGLICCNGIEKMKKTVNQLYAKGTVIVSAFDNNGAISFPAALDKVIGVDGDETITDFFDFRKVENSVVNVIGRNKNLRVAWTEPPFNIVRGTSYTCCFVTAHIAKQIAQDGFFKEENISCELIKFPKVSCDDVGFELGRIAIFPLNKEIHSLAQFEELLVGTVAHYYSSKFAGNINYSIHSKIGHLKNERIIENIDSINWGDFDTLVLGHLDFLSNLCHIDYKRKLIVDALKEEKNIFSFDDLSEIVHEFQSSSNSKIYYPHIDSSFVLHRFGKMYKTNTPIICVSGTSSSQGKFTLQLFIRKKLLDAGYKIGQLGTEPSSYLFGFDKCFPCGYMSTVKLTVSEIYAVVNQMVWEISQKNCDIIIAGTQSSLTAYSNSNIKKFPVNHQMFFEALQPDIIILCINPYDNIEYISRNIKTAEGLSHGKVIGIVCFPMTFDLSWKGNLRDKRRISLEEELNLRKIIKKTFGLNMFMLDKEEQLIELINDILRFLS